KLFRENRTIQEVYEELTVKDVQDACDILRPVYDESEGVDGFVSLEVSPHLARDTEGTMIEARRLFQKLNRPNCFIKIPATHEGIPAIEEMLYEGININITLLFEVKTYEAVAEAYIRALTRRVAEGKSIKRIRSVASFFLSRIDVLVDSRLSRLSIPQEKKHEFTGPKELFGAAAIANAKLAYQAFNKIFNGERWKSLIDNGAHVQRPLWASTGTKDPKYKDVKYVEPLIGLNTVNTLPEETIAAFADHGIASKDTILLDVKSAEKILVDLKRLGIDIDDVGRQLLEEGVMKFKDAYDMLLNNLKEKRKAILSDSTLTLRSL
ncbi:MAG: transaldolase, partial [Bacteroidota bacterium]